MRFKGLDLNLIVALNVLLEERSVTGAAKRLHLSQPAASGSLNRLREYFHDDLIVSVGRRMVPTARGEQLLEQSRHLLGEIDLLVAGGQDFVPGTSDRCFHIAASDYAIEVLLAPLVQRLSRTAPNLRFNLYPLGPRAFKGFQNGDIDAMILTAPYVDPAHPSHRLLTDRAVVMGWKDNEALHPRVSRDELLAFEHVTIDIGDEPERSFYEHQLRRLREIITRTIVVPNFHSVPRFLVGTQRVTLMHRRLAELQVIKAPLKYVANPFDFEPFEDWLQIHCARIKEPALDWLVRQMCFENRILDCDDHTPATSHPTGDPPTPLQQPGSGDL